MENITDFVKNANGLSKNPLGIIALFISLIYGFACIVLGVSLNNLSENFERLPLIWFIILFPVLILGGFIYLVINHHEKLYAPSDFRDDSAFIKAMGSKDVEEKFDKEVESLKDVLKTDSSHSVEEESHLRDTEIEIGKVAHGQISKSISPQSLSIKIKNAENWAINEYCLLNNYPVTRNQRIVAHGGAYRFEFDGVVRTNDSYLGIEVKYFADSKLSNNLKLKLQESIREYNKMKKIPVGRLKFIPVILIVLDSVNETIKEEFLNFISQIDKDIKIEFYSYLDLKEKYQDK